MLDFLVLGTLTWKVLLLFIIQLIVITTVVRGIMACQQWIYWRSWRVNTGLVFVGHALALAVFAVMTDFVDAEVPPLEFPDSMLHSMAVLWPLQVVLLGGDLAIRAVHGRRDAES